MNTKARPRVSFDELEDAMSMVRQNTASCYLHRSTGEIVMLFESDGDDELLERLDEDPDAYVSIPPEDSHRMYEQMVEFAESIDEDDIRAQLEVTLCGSKGVFGRFRDVIARYPDVRARFDAYIYERKVADVKAWLEREGLDVELVTRLAAVPDPPAKRLAAREPDFVDLLMLGGKAELLSGKVHRSLVLPNAREARAAFVRIARQMVEHCGHSWRRRYVENTSKLEMDRFTLVHDDRRVELVVETPSEIYRRFAE